MSKDTGGFVYACVAEPYLQEGITRRDWLADKAMVSMLNALIVTATDFNEGKLEEKLSSVHKWAYLYADRQIAEGKKKG